MVLKTYIMREKMCLQPKIRIATKILLPKYRINESVTQLLWFCHGMKIKKFEWITNLYFINLLIIWLSFITMCVDSINIWEVSCYFHNGMNTLDLYHILVIQCWYVSNHSLESLFLSSWIIASKRQQALFLIYIKT